MTVKVVGQDPEFVKETSCRNCSSKLSYVQADVFIHYHSTGSRKKEQSPAIKCPACGKPVIVK